jgi:hypothetical protein
MFPIPVIVPLFDLPLLTVISSINNVKTTTLKMTTPEIRKSIATAIGGADRDLWKINQQVGSPPILANEADAKYQLWKNPEVMFEEVRASKILSDWLEARGWTVKHGVYGIETAFEARFSVKEGGRTVCYNAEYGKLVALQRKGLSEQTT